MSDIELKPCPFCKCKKIELWPMINGWFAPVCTKCGANINENYSTGANTKKQIKAWNTRA